MSEVDERRAMLRHTVATLAYRASKAIRDAPEHFGGLSVGPGSRTPMQILGHIADVLDWGLSMAQGEMKFSETDCVSWDETVARFYVSIAAFDEYLGSGEPLHAPAEKLFQGPVADSLTHVGQLTMLRRLAEAPVRGENYFVADIRTGTTGSAQPPARYEFD